MKKMGVFWSVLLLIVGPVAANNQLLLIESHSVKNPWVKDYRKGIKESLNGQYDITSFSMNTDTIPERQWSYQANLAWRIYKDVNPDLVFIGDDLALKYLGPRFENTHTPVVYLGISDDPDYYVATINTNMTGLIKRPLLTQSVEMVQQLLSKLKRVKVLMDNSATTKAMIRAIGKTKFTLSGVQVDIVQAKSWERWRQVVRQSKSQGYQALILGLSGALNNRHGHAVSHREIIQWTTKNAPVPPFSFYKQAIGKHKLLGGVVLDGYAQGRAAARLAEEILRQGGKVKNTSQHVESKGQWVISKSQMQKWLIPIPSRLRQQIEFIE